MRELHAKTREEYAAAMESLHGDGRWPDLAIEARSAIEDWIDDEDFSAWVAGFGSEPGLESGAELHRIFFAKYPRSLHPVRVAAAAAHAAQDRIDHAANEARAYLHAVAEGGFDKPAASIPPVRFGIAQALLLLSGVYTESGARSYSRRLLARGIALLAEPEWCVDLNAELQRLEAELGDPSLAKLDAQWEQFFAAGAGALELARRCNAIGCPILAKRVETIAELKAEPAGFQVDDREMFLLVYRSEAGAYLLA